MGENARCLDDRLGGAAGQQGEQGGQAAEREQQHQQVLHRDAQAGQQGQGDHRSSQQAGGIEEVEQQGAVVQQQQAQAEAVGQQGEHAKQTEQALVGHRATGKQQGLVECGPGIQAGGRQAGQQRRHKSLWGKPRSCRVWHRTGYPRKPAGGVGGRRTRL
ncbi:hypothetical protein D3C80_1305520 [compost metagenome]